MERLYTPWRMEYILSDKSGCVFCEKLREGDDGKNYILRRGESSFVIMNIYPYNNGHLMIAPLRHVDLPSALTREEGIEILDHLRLSERILREAFRPEGFNIGANIGRCAGAGIIGHFHLHVVPRWTGDTNYMPVVADTKVMPESLDRTYERLVQALSSLR